LLRTTASSRIVTGSASKNTTGYIGSSGRACQAVTSATTASVTVLIRSGETSTSGSSRARTRNPVHLAEERLNLADGQTARVQRDDLAVESGEAGPSSVSTVFPLVPVR
jgi:hypothetical protein